MSSNGTENDDHQQRLAQLRNLCIVIRQYGKDHDVTRECAIQYCRAANIDPFVRYIIKRLPIIYNSPPSIEEMTKPLDINEYSIEEWRKLINEVAKRDAQL